MNSTDLTNCDREQIQHITYVQGHGALIGITPLDLKIHFASENIGRFFNVAESVHHFIGKKLNELLSGDLAMSIQSMIRSGESGHLEHSEYDVFIFPIYDNVYAVEFEHHEEADAPQPVESILNDYIQRMHQSETLDALSNEACRAIRKLTGMERVMLYRFFPPSMYGEVIGEDKSAEAHSFMGHRFPATDIPKPARDLYLKNQVRLIYDSEKEDFEVYPKISSRNRPLDMSDSRLRGVSRIHLEYLKNMGVRTSLSFAIIVDERLWGLIACHNSSPLHISHHKRELGRSIASAYALAATLIERIQYQSEEISFFNKLYSLFEIIKQSDSPLKQLFREGPLLLKLFNCSGMALLSSERSEFFGLTPLPDDLKTLHQALFQKLNDENKSKFATDSLVQSLPELAHLKDQVSGLLAIRVNEMSDKLFIVMRPEYLETIYWGGDPRKNIDARNYGGQINPRESFDTWTEVIKNFSTPWQSYEIKGMESFRNMFFDALINKEELLIELQKKLSMPKD